MMAGAPPTPPDAYSLARELAEIKRDMRLLAARRIPASSLPNELLASPLQVATDRVQSSGAAIAGTGTDLVDLDFTVPDGFTAASISASGYARGVNTTAAAQWLDSTVFILLNGAASSVHQNSTRVAVGASLANGTLAVINTTLTGLTPGDVITVRLRCAVSTAAPLTTTDHGASALLVYTR